MPRTQEDIARQARANATRPALERGMRVAGHAPGLSDWVGTVKAVKYSMRSGWYVDIDDDEGWSRTYHADNVEVLDA